MRAVYLGDEVSAAGYRLAGIEVIVTKDGEEAQSFARVPADAALMLVSSAVAARVPPATLQRAASALHPLLLIVPARGGEARAPELVQRLRVQLGLPS
jgi:vacuolar-type H+-ATPase subunit F/Vma7